MALVLADPSLRDLVDRYRIEVVELLAAAPDGRDEIGALQYGQMLAHRLPRHGRSRLGKARTNLVQGLSIVRVEPVEKLPAAGIRQGLEHIVHGDNMQPFGCLSTPNVGDTGQAAPVAMHSDEDGVCVSATSNGRRIASAAVPIGTHPELREPIAPTALFFRCFLDRIVAF